MFINILNQKLVYVNSKPIKNQKETMCILKANSTA